MRYFYEMDMLELGKNFGNMLSQTLGDQLSNKDYFDEKWKKCCAFGLFELVCNDKITRESWKDIVSFMYGMGLEMDSVDIVFSVNVQMWACILPIMHFKTNAIHESWLRKLLTGEKICAHAISEAMAGSDVFNIHSEYERTKDGYILNGCKNYVTNAPYADLYMVYARKKGTKGYRGISCFLVPQRTKGLVVGESINKMGMERSPMASIYLNNCVIGEELCLGKEGQGIFIFNQAMLYERPLLLAFQVGMMERQMVNCVKFCKERKQGGNSIIDYQSVSNRLADMKVNVEACKLFVRDIIETLDNARMDVERASLIKLFVSEKIIENSMLALKNYGTYGYLKECPIEQNVRDGLGSLFYSGTSDIQRNIIAQELLHHVKED